MTTYRVTGGLVTEGMGGKLTGPIELTPLATRQPVPGRRYFESYGVCAHPNFANEAYGDTDAWTQKLADLGVYAFRGMFANNLPHVQRTLVRAKELGLKWLATVAALDTTNAQIVARLDAIAADPSPFIAIEGVNEPDKDGLTATEVQRVIDIQTLIWTYVRDHDLPVVVLAPALQMKAPLSRYQRFATKAGILGKFDAVSIHHYNNHLPPSAGDLKLHLDMVQDVWKCDRFWVSETGYTNALNSTDPRTVTEAVSASYSIPNVLDFLSDPRVEKVFRYELMDDNDPSLSNNEAHFGLARIDGSAKPEAAVMTTFLDTVRDAIDGYYPPEVDLEVEAPAGVQQLLVGQSDGSATLWLWRPDTPFDSTPVEVELVTAAGIGTVQVGGAAIGVPIY